MKRFAIVVLIVVCLTCSISLTQVQPAALYKDPHAPMDARVDDLISRMTLEEKFPSSPATPLPSIVLLSLHTTGGTKRCTALGAPGVRRFSRRPSASPPRGTQT